MCLEQNVAVNTTASVQKCQKGVSLEMLTVVSFALYRFMYLKGQSIVGIH